MSYESNSGINIASYYLIPVAQEIMKKLYYNSSLSRRELVKLLSTPRTTIYDNLVKLQKRKLIEKFSRNNGKRGRPIVYWTLTEKGRWYHRRYITGTLH